MRECSPPQTCRVSHVTCHVSRVTYRMSHVTCHMSRVTFFFLFFSDQLVKLIGGGSVINGATPSSFVRKKKNIWSIIFEYLFEPKIHTLHFLQSKKPVTFSVAPQFGPNLVFSEEAINWLFTTGKTNDLCHSCISTISICYCLLLVFLFTVFKATVFLVSAFCKE